MKLPLQKGPYTAIVDTKGGELISFKDERQTEYIWSGDSKYWSGRNPILFPIVGALKNGRVRMEGRDYQMVRHGFARNSEFQVAEQGEDFVRFELKESPDTLSRYPYPFTLWVTHRLTGNGFTTTFQVTNPDVKPLPFCVGAHTAFNCPLHTGERFEDYQLVFETVENSGSLALTPQGTIDPDKTEPILCNTDTIPLRYEPFKKLDTLIFDGLRSKRVKLVHKDTGHGVQMAFQDFPMIAFWTTTTEDNAPYICLEPWHGCAAWDNESGLFTDKPHCIILQPGVSRSLSYTVELL